MRIVSTRQLRYVGHVLWKESLEVERFLGWLERAKSGIQPLHIISRLKHQRDSDVITAAYVRILARPTN